MITGIIGFVLGGTFVYLFNTGSSFYNNKELEDEEQMQFINEYNKTHQGGVLSWLKKRIMK